MQKLQARVPVGGNHHDPEDKLSLVLSFSLPGTHAVFPFLEWCPHVMSCFTVFFARVLCICLPLLCFLPKAEKQSLEHALDEAQKQVAPVVGDRWACADPYLIQFFLQNPNQA